MDWTPEDDQIAANQRRVAKGEKPLPVKPYEPSVPDPKRPNYDTKGRFIGTLEEAEYLRGEKILKKEILENYKGPEDLKRKYGASNYERAVRELKAAEADKANNYERGMPIGAFGIAKGVFNIGDLFAEKPKLTRHGLHKRK